MSGSHDNSAHEATPTAPISGRLGVYCDYGATLWPEAGIGVFVYNLIDGLMRVAPRLQVVVQCAPGDQARLHSVARRRGWRIEVVPRKGAWSAHLKRRWWGSSHDARQRLARAHAAWESWQSQVEARRIHWPTRFRAAAKAWLKRVRESWRTSSGVGRLWPAALIGLSVAAFPLVWLAAALYYLAFEFAAPVVLRPMEAALHVARWLVDRESATSPPPPRGAADVDAWLIPYAGTTAQFDAPEIVGIWDLVHHHVPEVYTPEQAEITDRLFAFRVNQASLVFCGSRHVLEQDLRRVFPAASKQMRVLPLAPPSDLSPPPAACWKAWRRSVDLGPRYLLYPASFAAHKNHRTLIQAMRRVRQRPEYCDVELALTGAPVPPQIRALVAECGLQDAVRFVGRVSREELAMLYEHAALTPLPSLHEGYGLPLLEAIMHGVPVACADIPAFRDLMSAHPGSVLFFDPRHERFIADAILRSLDSRGELLARQREARQAWSARTWDDVAREFLALFDEARGFATPVRKAA